MIKPNESPRSLKAWQKHYVALAPKAGDMAPDFELRDAQDEHPVRLPDLRGKRPVALAAPRLAGASDDG